MSDSNKKDGCTVTYPDGNKVHHAPDCKVTDAVRTLGDLLVKKEGEEACDSGPAKFSSKAFRSGYDQINWGGKRTVGEA